MSNHTKKNHQIVNINNLNISYCLNKRKKFGPKISVIFLSGYRSDMSGSKAIFFDNMSKKIGFEYLRFDYSGHGNSEGKINEQLLSSWINEASFFIENKTNYPIIIVGSSLGAWIALVLCKKKMKKIKGLIGIGSAPDFTYDIINKLTRKEKKSYEKNEFFSFKSDYSEEEYVFTKNFIEDSKKYFILRKNEIISDIVVKLFYGTLDKAVSLKKQLRLLKILNVRDVTLTIIKNSDHRMSSVKDLKVLDSVLQNMIKDLL